MKKKIILKIIVSVLSIAIFVWFLFSCIENIKISVTAIKKYGNSPEVFAEIIDSLGETILREFIMIISSSFVFLAFNLSDFNYLSGSLIKMLKSHCIKNADNKKQKKQKQLEKDIAKKQAMLEEMKKDGE